jgi:glycosyltransferase involved in cell wall biosynthesis
MLLLDVSHTSHTTAQTGIQRVVRRLYRELGVRAKPVTYDPYLRSWRNLRESEQRNLVSTVAGGKRGASWPLSARIAGLLGRLGRHHVPLMEGAGTLVPEIFAPAVSMHLAALPRPRVAVFHDAIALKLPELTPSKTVARCPAYLEELLQFDGVGAVSEDSAQALVAYWRWLGVKTMPVVRVIPLGVDAPAGTFSGSRLAGGGSPCPTVLSVGSIEGRKNHRALIEACQQLWSAGAKFELHLVGMARPETAGDTLARIAALRAAGRPIRHDANADDSMLACAYEAAVFTVYPSLMEGFGLPVLESLAYGKPCICSGAGALGEAARGGGCLMLDRVDAPSLSVAMQRLLTDGSLREKLQSEARTRRLRTWTDYANDLFAWIADL